jgi:ABC-type glycerol-3-phosphate transport system permease component
MESLFWTVCIGLILLACFAGGVWMIVHAINSKRKAEASQSWPGVQGMVTKTWIQKNETTDSEGLTSTTFQPRVSYEYSVGGQSYSGDRLAFGAGKAYGRYNKAEEVLASYPVNNSVMVYYDPQNPAEATLLQQAQGGLGMIIAGAILVIIPILVGCGLLIAMVMDQ